MFPQFVHFRADDAAVQFALLAETGITVDIIVLSTCAGVADSGGRLMATCPLAVWRYRISGAALVIVGSALSLVKRTVRNPPAQRASSFFFTASLRLCAKKRQNYAQRRKDAEAQRKGGFIASLHWAY